MTLRTLPWIGVVIALVGLAACSSNTEATTEATAGPLDDALERVIATNELTPVARPEAPPGELLALGSALFFDPELSGNRDVSCATCHLPNEATGDGLRVSIGTGGTGLGDERTIGEGPRIPRNAPEIFNRGDDSIRTMFWDMRVAQNEDGSYESPAGAQLPVGLTSVLAAQALFPLTSREEMRGQPGDTDVRGAPNELANVDDGELTTMWRLVLARLTALSEYQELFGAAYPYVPPAGLEPAHMANAIAAFEATAFASTETPWDHYLAGDTSALTDSQKRGAQLFYGEARCSSCHTGTLLTDQLHHNVGVPQIGPGKSPGAPADRGRELVSGSAADAFAFRTPPLRNVTITGPYMHDGAYENLEDAVRHMLNPRASLTAYVGSGLPPDLRPGSMSEKNKKEILATLSPLLLKGVDLNDEQFDELMAFLEALTDPGAEQLQERLPSEVPSGLPVAGGSAP